MKCLSDEKLEFPRSLLVLGNLGLLAWVGLASVSVAITNVLYGGGFLVFAAAIVFLILRRTGCSSCYYCKTCTSGFGRLSGWFFGNRNTKDLRNKTALAFVAFVYVLLIPFPLTFVTISLFQGFTTLKILVLACLLLLSAYSMFTWLKPRPQRRKV